MPKVLSLQSQILKLINLSASCIHHINSRPSKPYTSPLADQCHIPTKLKNTNTVADYTAALGNKEQYHISIQFT